MRQETKVTMKGATRIEETFTVTEGKKTLLSRVKIDNYVEDKGMTDDEMKRHIMSEHYPSGIPA